jgi:OHCU decarboxylase
MNDSTVKFPEPPSAMSEGAFLARFGGVYEHSPWIARQTWQRGLSTEHDSVDGLAQALAETLAKTNRPQQLELIRAHPDLAARAAIRGELTRDSSDEQASAGLDQCSAEEFERLQQLNKAYQEKFGFPFIMAVRGSNRHAILAGFEQRLQNDAETEFARALQEINNIVRMRLQNIAIAAT